MAYREAPASHAAHAMARTKRSQRKRWSQRVTETSNALDLEGGVFNLRDPAAIARSLKRSAEQSRRRKSDPYRSAMSMLTFYINRAGRNLGARQRRTLERAKEALRAAFGR
jgi:RNA polymerase-interacting CarD/CdnL/TRCF family regulator